MKLSPLEVSKIPAVIFQEQDQEGDDSGKHMFLKSVHFFSKIVPHARINFIKQSNLGQKY